MKNMKLVVTTTLTLLGLFVIGNTAVAQRNALKVYPLSSKIAYERMFSSNISGQLALKILPIPFNIEVDGTKFSIKTYSALPEIRFYLGKDRETKLGGFYLSPYIKGGITSVNATVVSESDLEESVKFRGSIVGTGATVGWQWISGGGFSIGTAVGYGFSRLFFDDVTVTYSDGTTEKEEFRNANFGWSFPQLRFSIGYAF